MTNKTNEQKDNHEVETEQTILNSEETEVVDSEHTEEQADETITEDNEVEQLQAKLDQSENDYLRLRADFDNYRRRVQKDTEAASKYRSQNLVTDLLPVLDNFERALDMDPQSEEAKSLLKGMEMVFRLLKQAIEAEGVTEIAPDGETFDPNFHQAVMQEASDSHESGTVIQTLQKGYQLKDRIIRPAMVKVSE